MYVKTFTVLPGIPDNLKPLHELAGNIWSHWNYEALQLFKELDPESWTE